MAQAMAEKKALTYGFEMDKAEYKIPLSGARMMQRGAWSGSKAAPPGRAGLHNAVRSQQCRP